MHCTVMKTKCTNTSSRSLSFTPGKPRRGLQHTSTRDLANKISIDLMLLKCPLSPLHSLTFTYQSAPEPVVLHLDHKHCRLQLCLPEIGFAKVKKGENACVTTWHSMTEPSALVISPSEQNIGLSLDPTSPSLSSTSILLEAAQLGISSSQHH